MKKTVLAVFIFFANILFCAATSRASSIPSSPIQEPKAECLQTIDFLAGFGWGNLHGQNGYRFIPFLADFGFNLKGFLNKFSLSPKSLIQFQIEPFIGPIYSPHDNLEMGNTFWLKFGLLPDTSKFQPYVKAGAGFDYMTMHSHEQSTQFNFIEQGAIGMHYFFSKNNAFTLEGRMRHLSNASIDEPNHGINTYYVVTGITHRF